MKGLETSIWEWGRGWLLRVIIFWAGVNIVGANWWESWHPWIVGCLVMVVLYGYILGEEARVLRGLYTKWRDGVGTVDIVSLHGELEE